jgi:hypothetical protein
VCVQSRRNSLALTSIPVSVTEIINYFSRFTVTDGCNK